MGFYYFTQLNFNVRRGSIQPTIGTDIDETLIQLIYDFSVPRPPLATYLA